MFSAYTPLAGGVPATMFFDSQYPYDYDSSLNFTRMRSDGNVIYPHPSTIGYIDGLLPMFDSLEFSLMLGKTPYGGLMGNNTPMNVVFPDVFGGMRKKE